MPKLGGADAGPAPYEYLLASLGACTAITLRMYAERKEWPLEALEVSLHYERKGDVQHIERTLHFTGALDEGQRTRLADIAERTPVTLTLKGGLAITTALEPPLAAAALEAKLDEALEETFSASDAPSITR
ncbi:MAG: OsmC family protein [Rhizomicrobium sp.]